MDPSPDKLKSLVQHFLKHAKGSFFKCWENGDYLLSNTLYSLLNLYYNADHALHSGLKFLNYFQSYSKKILINQNNYQFFSIFSHFDIFFLLTKEIGDLLHQFYEQIFKRF